MHNYPSPSPTQPHIRIVFDSKKTRIKLKGVSQFHLKRRSDGTSHGQPCGNIIQVSDTSAGVDWNPTLSLLSETLLDAVFYNEHFYNPCQRPTKSKNCQSPLGPQ